MKELIDAISQPAIMVNVQAVIILPLLGGLLLLFIPEKARILKGSVALAFTGLTFVFAIVIFGADSQLIKTNTGITADILSFGIDGLSKLIVLLAGLFSVLIVLYSIVYIRGKNIRGYYTWVLLTLGCSCGALLADNLLLFIFFWGVLGITLYKLVCSPDEASSATAKKTLILIGASDSIMIAGIAIIWKINGSLSMSSDPIATDNLLSATAFLALLIGSFTKAGAFPFHTWVPDYAENAPAPSSAYLPASLDKLLGIYFLARITGNIFELNEWISFLLLAAGAITIIAAVMMALVQHDYKRLLGYHAVSQVGYMITGFGLGSFIGVAAGLFHLVNNAVYKSGLFLSAGCIEHATGKKKIDELGGLSKAMPVTFAASVIFALSISGVPPFNGFASKWMIYQGIIDFGNGAGIANKLWILWLGFAVMGSALTLASFIKFIGGIFLGRRTAESETTREVPAAMWMPTLFLALMCLFLGVFATGIVVPGIFMPVSGDFVFHGYWDSAFVSILVLVSMVLGIIVYLALGIKKFRVDDSFIGGEKIQEQTGYPTPEFYKTITEFGFFSWMYRKAADKWFDIYDVSKKYVLWLSHILGDAHTGVLPGYVIWVFAGLIIMLLIMI